MKGRSIRKIVSVCITVVLFTAVISQAQEAELYPVKYKKIKKAISKKKSEFYYPGLFQRYLDMDTTLTVEEFRHLYYGFTFQKEYSPYGIPSLQDSLISYLSREGKYAQEYEVAARIGSELLRESPFRLRETFITAVSFEMAGNLHLSSLYFNFYQKLVDAILLSGDGLSTNTAFTVIYIQDEYELLELLGFTFGGQQYLLQGGFDMLELEKNPAGINSLYFNVQKLLDVGFR
jgi:hypothetical protein